MLLLTLLPSVGADVVASDVGVVAIVVVVAVACVVAVAFVRLVNVDVGGFTDTAVQPLLSRTVVAFAVVLATTDMAAALAARRKEIASFLLCS